MPHYYLHLVDGTDVLLDPDGMEMRAEDVPANALWCARDCMAGDVGEVRLDLRYSTNVHDEHDCIVHTLLFAAAVRVLT